VDETWHKELQEFIAIPSVSADPAHREDVKRAGEWVCDFIRRIGGTAELTPFGEKELALGDIPASHDPANAPTVLCYGHFDVQPPAPLDLWESDPYELTVRDEWAYATTAARTWRSSSTAACSGSTSPSSTSPRAG
jgi:acetylornithine deacetylase/succinyl-diaminopimelate desuccinylase-like protein